MQRTPALHMATQGMMSDPNLEATKTCNSLDRATTSRLLLAGDYGLLSPQPDTTMTKRTTVQHGLAVQHCDTVGRKRGGPTMVGQKRWWVLREEQYVHWGQPYGVDQMD